MSLWANFYDQDPKCYMWCSILEHMGCWPPPPKSRHFKKALLPQMANPRGARCCLLTEFSSTQVHIKSVFLVVHERRGTSQPMALLISWSYICWLQCILDVMFSYFAWTHFFFNPLPYMMPRQFLSIKLGSLKTTNSKCTAIFSFDTIKANPFIYNEYCEIYTLLSKMLTGNKNIQSLSEPF